MGQIMEKKYMKNVFCFQNILNATFKYFLVISIYREMKRIQTSPGPFHYSLPDPYMDPGSQLSAKIKENSYKNQPKSQENQIFKTRNYR